SSRRRCWSSTRRWPIPSAWCARPRAGISGRRARCSPACGCVRRCSTRPSSNACCDRCWPSTSACPRTAAWRSRCATSRWSPSPRNGWCSCSACRTSIRPRTTAWRPCTTCSAGSGAAPRSTATVPPATSAWTRRGATATSRHCRTRAGARTRPAPATSTATPRCSSASTASMARSTGWWSTAATRCIRAISTTGGCRRRTSRRAASRSTASSTCWTRAGDRADACGGRTLSALLLLMLQLSLVLAAAKACGAVLRRLGQPPVIGEMAGGLLLGPLAFGAWLPHAHAAVFPADSLPVLSGLGTLGVALFMFIMGAELRAPDGTRAQLRAAVARGAVGCAPPLARGLAVAPALYPRFAPDGVGYWPFALFVAAAISVTAFPVLARILRDRGLARSTPGRLALGAGLVNDAVVWIFLAAVLAVAGGGSGRAVAATAAGAVVLAGVAFRWLRPLYARLLRPAAGDGAPSSSALVPVLLGLLGCAAFSEWIGLHAIFGAFVFGACL